MLKDRRELLEHDLKVAQNQAANMYLSIVVGNSNIHSVEYQQLRDHVTQLQFDLNMVNKLIAEGAE
jgi:hypothetical protein